MIVLVGAFARREFWAAWVKIMRAFLVIIGLVIASDASAQGAGRPTHAEDLLHKVQLQDPSTMLVGTWRSGSFAYTFFGNGTYVYVGAMGGAAMSTQSSEQGNYTVYGDTLIIQRQSGRLSTSQNYTQNLGPQTTIFHWRLGNTPSGPGLQLIFPDGGAQIFYKE
jgi:hypothetical protein